MLTVLILWFHRRTVSSLRSSCIRSATLRSAGIVISSTLWPLSASLLTTAALITLVSWPAVIAAVVLLVTLFPVSFFQASKTDLSHHIYKFRFNFFWFACCYFYCFKFFRNSTLGVKLFYFLHPFYGERV